MNRNTETVVVMSKPSTTESPVQQGQQKQSGGVMFVTLDRQTFARRKVHQTMSSFHYTGHTANRSQWTVHMPSINSLAGQINKTLAREEYYILQRNVMWSTSPSIGINPYRIPCHRRHGSISATSSEFHRPFGCSSPIPQDWGHQQRCINSNTEKKVNNPF